MEFLPILGIALSLGILHALDADHILAVSVLSSDQHALKSSARYAMLWSLGHGLILFIVSLLFYQLGTAWPVFMSSIAERLVGLVLIGFGIYIALKLKRNVIHINFHTHDGLKPHAHWQDAHESQSSHQHKATLIGGLHGMAGSAPLLASLSLVQKSQLHDLILYIAVFSLGVFVAMVSFGGLLGTVLKKIISQQQWLFNAFQLILALLSIGIGARLAIS